MLQGGGGSVIMWGVICANVPGSIVCLQGQINSTKYINMLTEHFLPYFGQNLNDNLIFMQDNAPIYTAGNVKRFLEENDIPCLDWPAQSPDLNPIENVWHYIKQQLHNDKISNLEELGQKLKRSGVPFHWSIAAN